MRTATRTLTVLLACCLLSGTAFAQQSSRTNLRERLGKRAESAAVAAAKEVDARRALDNTGQTEKGDRSSKRGRARGIWDKEQNADDIAQALADRLTDKLKWEDCMPVPPFCVMGKVAGQPPNQGPLKNCPVLLIARDGIRRTTVTNAHGYYSFRDVPAGKCTVEAGAMSRLYISHVKVVGVTDRRDGYTNFLLEVWDGNPH